MVNGKTRNDGIKFAKIGKGLVQIVFVYGNPRMARETVAGARQHGRRKIDGNSRRLWETLQRECEQSAVAAA